MSDSPIAWPALPRVVEPLVRRHVEDAAFYWTQLDGGAQSIGLEAQRAAHFQRLLVSHLEGLQVAGHDGLVLAQEALTRWRKPGEVFAACSAALALPERDARTCALEPMLKTVRQLPDMLLRGLISALAWTNEAHATPWLHDALVADDAVLRVAALRASALRGMPVENWRDQANHISPHVRAAACRAARFEHLDQVAALRGDTDLQVRAESVLAWARLVPETERSEHVTAQAASQLWRCVSEQVELAAVSTGWHRMQAERRLDRWLHHLAWLAPLGHPGIPQLVERLTPRLALLFVLCHGDLTLMGFVLHTMGARASARWALVVWCYLTGVDAVAAGLTLPDPPPDLDAPLSIDQLAADQGLAMPDPVAVAAHPASRLSLDPGRRLLMGQPVHAQGLRALLDPGADQPQALRFIAAHALAQLHPDYALNLRASPQVQAAQLARMGIRTGR